MTLPDRGHDRLSGASGPSSGRGDVEDMESVQPHRRRHSRCDVALLADVRDPGKLRRYLRAVAASTAASPTLATLAEATDLDRTTIERYDILLERLFVTEQVPAWSSNWLTRVTRRTKRYVCDPAIAATVLGVDRRALLRNADLLGRIIDTFVAA